MNTPFPKNTSGQKIHSVTRITGIENFTVADSAFSAITAPGNCKAVIVNCRTGVEWYLADSSTATKYLTVDSTLTLSMAAFDGATMFYAKSSSGNITLEVVALD